MANVFNIRVTATDNATKVVQKINKSVSQIFRPYDEAKRKTGSFFNALGKNDLFARPIAGAQKFGVVLGNVGSQFGIAENSILSGSTRLAAALAGMGGPIGGFVAGGVAIVGAASAISVKMGTLGFDVQRVAKNLGVTTRELQQYRGAAQLAGLSTESMDSGLGSLATTLQDAAAGRNLQAATLLTRMGVTIKRTKDGAVDTVSALRDISDVVGKISDPNMAKKTADMLGIGELLPLVRQGTSAIDGYIATAQKAGLVQSSELIDSNEKQAQSWLKIKSSTEGLGISLGNLIAQYTNLGTIAENVEKLAQPVKNWADRKSADQKAPGAAPWWLPVAGSAMGPLGTMAASGLSYLMTPRGAAGSREASGLVTEATPGAAPGPAGATRGLRNNNPGNLRSWPGAGSNGGFATFPSADDGLKAAGQNLLAYQDKYGINTISKIINRWAPAADNNNVPAYVSAMSKSTGFDKDQPLDMRDPKVLAPLISAITKHENGNNPFDADTMMRAAVAAVQAQGGGAGGKDPIVLKFEGLPPGVTVKAVRGLGQPSVGMTNQPGGKS